MAVTDKVAEVYARYGSNSMVKKFINDAIRGKATGGKAFKRTISKLASQKGSAALKGIGSVAKAGALGYATYKGAKKIRDASKKTNAEISRLSDQSSKQSDSILTGLRAKNKKRRKAMKKEDKAKAARYMKGFDSTKWGN